MRLTRIRALAVALLSALPLGVFAFAPAASAAPHFFQIRNVGSNKCIGMPYPNGTLQTGIPVVQTVCGAYGTVWRSDAYAVNARTLMNESNGMCMQATALANGWPVVQQNCGNTTGEFWDWGPDVYPQPRAQTVTIKQSSSNFCLDLENGQTQNGVPMQVWTCNPSTNNQKWVIYSLDS